ncbi:methyl-cpg-binding domain-containing protein 13 [Quercus suber]|uniref:Methyl-cpg-binding domain-containing protein 13 n=1 Tax=Quercus suber TaxID=58331 RepID=A0AAW0IH74_QUESU
MTDQSSEDWLPTGWTVEVKVRRSGKKDKYYFAPSSRLRFSSKAEVSRYLKTHEISDPTPEQMKTEEISNPEPEQKQTQEISDSEPEQKKTQEISDLEPEQKQTQDISEFEPAQKQTQDISDPEQEQKIRGSPKQSGKRKNVIVEEVIAEGLPPGWIKEIKVTKKGHKIRRDMFYTDPVSGYVFRSMKDVLRYLETGDLGRLAYKPKDNRCIDMELEDDSISPPAVAKKQKLALGSIGELIISDQSSKLDGMIKDEQILGTQHHSAAKCMPLSEHTDQSSKLLEAKDSEQINGKNDSTESAFGSSPVVGFLTSNQPLERKGTLHENEKTQLERFKPKNKKEYNLPRRASKRLAGLDVDPTLELKTSRARRVVGKLSSEAGASTPPSSSPGGMAHWESQQQGQLKAGMEAEINFSSSKSIKVLEESINSKHTFAEHTGKIERETKDDQKQESSAVLPIRNLAILEHAGMVEKVNQDNEKPDIPIDLPSMDLWSDPCIQFAIKTLTGVGVDSPKGTELAQVSNNRQQAKKVETAINGPSYSAEHAEKVGNNCKDYEKPGSPLDMDFGDLWRDPCIEFAVKTLTGAIPVDCVLDIQDSFQTQQSSSQFDAVENPSYRHQALIEPVLPQTGNVSLQNAGTIRHQQSEGRGTRCQ